MRDGMILYTSYAERFCLLSDEQFGKLIRYMIEYQRTGIAPMIEDIAVKLAFSMAKVDIDNNNDKYEKTVQRNRENGKKGGRPANPVEPKKPSGLLENQKNPVEPKKADKEKDKEKEKDKDIKNIRHKYGAFRHVLLTDDEFNKLVEEYGEIETKLAIQKVDDYCEETGKSYKNYSLVLRRWGYKAVREAKPNTPVLLSTPEEKSDLKALEELYMSEVQYG